MDFQDRSDDEDLWAVIEITGETTLKYKIRWAGLDPATGKPWPQDWIPKKDVTNDLVDAWRAKGNQAKGRQETCSPAAKGPVQPSKRRRSVMKEAMDEDEEHQNDNVISVRKGSWKDGWQVSKSVSASSKTTQRSASSSLPPGAEAHSRARATTKANSALSKSPQATSRPSTSSSIVQCMRKHPYTSEDEPDLLSKKRKVDTPSIPSHVTSVLQNDQSSPELQQRIPDPLFLESDSPEPERELEGWREPEPMKTLVAMNSGVQSTKDTLLGPVIPRLDLIRAMSLGLAEVGMHIAIGLDSGPIVQGSLKDTVDSQETRGNDQAVRESASDSDTNIRSATTTRSDGDSEASGGSVGLEKAQADNAAGNVASVGEGMSADNDALDTIKAPYLELQDVDTDDESSYLIHFDAVKNDHISSSYPQARRATSIDNSRHTPESSVDNMHKCSADGSREPLHPSISATETEGYRREEASTKDLERREIGAEDGEPSGESIEENASHNILDMELQYPDDDEFYDVQGDPTSSHAEETIRDLQRQLSEKCAELAEKDAQLSLLQEDSCTVNTTTPTDSLSAPANTVPQTSSCTRFLEQRVAWLEEDAQRWRQAAEFIIRKDELKADGDKRELDRLNGELAKMRARAEEAERVIANMRSEEEKRLTLSAGAG